MDEQRAEMEAFCADAFPRLVGALSLHTGDVHLAEELAQEALLRACRHWPKVGQLESPGGWAYRVAVNLASNRFRGLRAARRAAHRLAGEATAVESPAPGVTDAVVVGEALRELTDQQREVVILRFYFGMTAPQIAAVTGSTAGAVRGLIHRAVAALRELLGPEVVVPADEEAAYVS